MLTLSSHISWYCGTEGEELQWRGGPDRWGMSMKGVWVDITWETEEGSWGKEAEGWERAVAQCKRVGVCLCVNGSVTTRSNHVGPNVSPHYIWFCSAHTKQLMTLLEESVTRIGHCSPSTDALVSPLLCWAICFLSSGENIESNFVRLHKCEKWKDDFECKSNLHQWAHFVWLCLHVWTNVSGCACVSVCNSWSFAHACLGDNYSRDHLFSGMTYNNKRSRANIQQCRKREGDGEEVKEGRRAGGQLSGQIAPC